MSTASFASLHAGLLARKGEARPAPEPTTFSGAAPAPIFQPANRRTIITPPPLPVEDEADADADVSADAYLEDVAQRYEADPSSEDVAGMKARIRSAYATWPVQKQANVAPKAPPPQQQQPSYAAGDDEWRPALAQHGSTRHPVRSSIRMTQAQARALRLASLVLDRPQQELIEAGLQAQLQALACTDLANCACFQAVLAMIDPN
jgi:hypothetical protein